MRAFFGRERFSFWRTQSRGSLPTMFAETDEPKTKHGSRPLSARRKQSGARPMFLRRWMLPCLGVLAWVAGGGCSIHRFAVNQFSDAVSQSGAVFASDDDPDLVCAASPFSLKLIESLLNDNPRHRGLLLAA